MDIWEIIQMDIMSVFQKKTMILHLDNSPILASMKLKRISCKFLVMNHFFKEMNLNRKYCDYVQHMQEETPCFRILNKWFIFWEDWYKFWEKKKHSGCSLWYRKTISQSTTWMKVEPKLTKKCLNIYYTIDILKFFTSLILLSS